MANNPPASIKGDFYAQQNERAYRQHNPHHDRSDFDGHCQPSRGSSTRRQRLQAEIGCLKASSAFTNPLTHKITTKKEKTS